MTEPIDLDAIRNRADTATEGPWTTGADKEWSDALVPWALVINANYPLTELAKGPQGTADAEFIAHARQDVPRLVDEVERLRAYEAMATELREARDLADDILDGTAKTLGLDLDNHHVHHEIPPAVAALRAEVERLRGAEAAVLHTLALAPDEYRVCIIAARASMSSEDYAKNNGRAEMIRTFATGLAERAGLPVTDWEQIKRDVPSDGVWRPSDAPEVSR